MMSNLYVIVDRISNLMYSQVIPAVSDLVAVFGFTKFIKGEEEKGLAPAMYSLVRIGKIAPDGRISDTDYVTIVTGDKAQEMYDNELVKALEEEEN